MIIRDLTPFEKEYFSYQKELERDHAAPFASEFYFKKGSVAERQWKQQEAQQAATPPSYSPSSPSTSTAKSKGGSATASGGSTGDDEILAEEQKAKIELNDRITDADRKNDVRSLERALQRTLYLIVKKPREEHAWQFPQGGVRVCENLQEVKRIRRLCERGKRSCHPSLERIVGE